MEALSLTCFIIIVWKQNGYFSTKNHTLCEPEFCIIIISSNADLLPLEKKNEIPRGSP
jgi:hypothetical protein